MTPDEIKRLRQELACTARELAETLGVDPATVRAWESEAEFPTKKWVAAMARLRQQGPDAIERKPRRKPARRTGLAALEDPRVWQIVRKLAANPEFLDRVARLAENEPDEPGSRASA